MKSFLIKWRYKIKGGVYAMKERFIENRIEYVRNGDYYIPNLTVPDD